MMCRRIRFVVISLLLFSGLPGWADAGYGDDEGTRILLVAEEGGDFNSIQAALKSIT